MGVLRSSAKQFTRPKNSIKNERINIGSFLIEFLVLKNNRLTANKLVLFVACCLLLVGNTQQDEVTSTTNQNVEINNNHETIKYGNHKTNNYNFMEHKYSPIQWTQLVLNIGKAKNKLRKSRPPTFEEYQIKERVWQVYEKALAEIGDRAHESTHFIHLGRILKALNPKYISTERVMRIAFADPYDPDSIPDVVPPELEPLDTDAMQQTQHEYSNIERLLESLVRTNGGGIGTVQPICEPTDKLILSSAQDLDSSLANKLDQLYDRFRTIVEWDKRFARDLFAIEDDKFSKTQLAFKRLIQCLTYPMSCGKNPKIKLVKKKANEANVVDQPVLQPQPLENMVTPYIETRAEEAMANAQAQAESEANAQVQLDTQARYADNQKVVDLGPTVASAGPTSRPRSHPQVAKAVPAPKQVTQVISAPQRTNYNHQPNTSVASPMSRSVKDSRPPSSVKQHRNSPQQQQQAIQYQDFGADGGLFLSPYGNYADSPENYPPQVYNVYQQEQVPDYGLGRRPISYENENNRQRYQVQQVDRYAANGLDYRQQPDQNLPERIVQRYSPNYRNDVRAIRAARQSNLNRQK